jgi:hypothetical protein
MRATRLIPYLHELKINTRKNSGEHQLYIQDELIYAIYKFNYSCFICHTDCSKTTCSLFKCSSKIACNVVINYNFYCGNSNLYIMEIDSGRVF